MVSYLHVVEYLLLCVCVWSGPGSCGIGWIHLLAGWRKRRPELGFSFVRFSFAHVCSFHWLLFRLLCCHLVVVIIVLLVPAKWFVRTTILFYLPIVSPQKWAIIFQVERWTQTLSVPIPTLCVVGFVFSLPSLHCWHKHCGSYTYTVCGRFCV